MAVKEAVLLLLTIIAATVSKQDSLPSFVKICKRNDPELSKCWMRTFEALKPYLMNGIPEFKIPPNDPFFVPVLNLKQEGGESLSFNAKVENITMRGTGNFNVKHFRVDLNQNFLNVVLYYPYVNITAQYKLNGKVLLFEIDAEGDLSCESYGNIVNTTVILKRIMISGKEHIVATNGTTVTKMQKSRINLSDLFKNNPEITEAVNKAINENSEVLYEEIEPILSSTVKTVTLDFMNRVFYKYPIDILLP